MNQNVVEAANKLKNYPADYINKDDIQDLRTTGVKDFSWNDRPVGDNTMSELNNDLNSIPVETDRGITNEDRSKQSLAALYKAADPLHRDINADEIKVPKEPKPKSDRAVNNLFRKNFGLLGKRIKKEDVEDAIENNPNEVIQSDMPEPAKVEARQIVEDNDTRNDEANDENVEAATKELRTRNVIPGSEPDPLGLKFTNEDRANWNGGEDNAIGDKTLSEMDIDKSSRTRPVKPNTEIIDRASPKGALGAGLLYSRDGNIPKPSEESPINAQELEQITESNPELVQETLPDTPIAEEARQITDDTNVNNDEVNNEAAEDTVDLIDWDKVKVYKPGEDATGYGIQQEPFDPRVEENLNYDYDQNIPQDDTFETSIEDTTQDFSPEIGELSDVVDYGLEDQNQYGADLPSEDETIIDEKMANTEPPSDDNFEPAPEAPYADNVVQLKQQKEQLDKELEEAEAEPVTDKESAIRKQNRVKMARAAIANFHASNPSFNNQIQQSNRSVSTGGRVSPSAGIGNIGGGAAGHGIMASSRPTKMTGNSHNSIASKAPLPHALEDNQGRVVSVNGKATTAPSSNNNGSFRSGSFGLMSKAKSDLKPIASKAPVSGGPEHIGSSIAGAGKGMPGDFNLEDGKQILIERLKQLLTQLTDEEKKEMGFSPALNQWNGKALIRLDGYTLQSLIDKTEKYLGEK
jgi:hypothetical protein